MERITRYHSLSMALTQLSDEELAGRLAEATPREPGIGGATLSLDVGGRPVFAKKVRLTDLERRPENWRSTANLFELPLYYQYRIGSAGFGAWRELAAHEITSHWVLSGECQSFPLLYHWRVLPSAALASNIAGTPELERSVADWGGCPAVRARLEAREGASTDIVLFLEHIPMTLGRWFRDQMTRDDAVARAVAGRVERELTAVTSFMRERGFLHFDAHFENILTDGERLYVTDFGLAISNGFALSVSETEFIARHRDYDRAVIAASLAHWAMPEEISREDSNSSVHPTPVVTEIVARCSAVAGLIREFYFALARDKNAAYPAEELARALEG